MPFGQKYKSALYRGFGKAKNFLGNAYSKTKDALSSMDSIVSDVKKIYGAVQPALKDMAPERLQGNMDLLDSNVKRGVERYDNIRNKIDTGEQKIRENVGRVIGDLKKANVDIGLS